MQFKSNEGLKVLHEKYSANTNEVGPVSKQFADSLRACIFKECREPSDKIARNNALSDPKKFWGEREFNVLVDSIKELRDPLPLAIALRTLKSLLVGSFTVRERLNDPWEKGKTALAVASAACCSDTKVSVLVHEALETLLPHGNGIDPRWASKLAETILPKENSNPESTAMGLRVMQKLLEHGRGTPENGIPFACALDYLNSEHPVVLKAAVEFASVYSLVWDGDVAFWHGDRLRALSSHQDPKVRSAAGQLLAFA